jgi:hypothetical protein
MGCTQFTHNNEAVRIDAENLFTEGNYLRSLGHTAARSLSVIEAAAAAVPPETARFVVRARVCGESWEIPVGLEAAE